MEFMLILALVLLIPVCVVIWNPVLLEKAIKLLPQSKKQKITKRLGEEKELGVSYANLGLDKKQPLADMTYLTSSNVMDKIPPSMATSPYQPTSNELYRRLVNVENTIEYLHKRLLENDQAKERHSPGTIWQHNI